MKPEADCKKTHHYSLRIPYRGTLLGQFYSSRFNVLTFQRSPPPSLPSNPSPPIPAYATATLRSEPSRLRPPEPSPQSRGHSECPTTCHTLPPPPTPESL